MLKVNFKKHKQNISYMPELNMQIKPFMFTKFNLNKTKHVICYQLSLTYANAYLAKSPVLFSALSLLKRRS